MLADTWNYLLAHPAQFSRALWVHITLSASALFLAAAISIPAGIAVARRSNWSLAVVNIANVARTLPSLAVLALVMPLLGTGFAPALFALTLIALPPIVTHTITAMRGVDADVVDAAIGMGMTRSALLWQVELPMALPVIFAGLRTGAVQVISGAVLAAFIGGGGLGDFITAGVAMMAVPQLLVGAVPVALLALASDFLFGALQRRMTPQGLRAP
ncbi:osmoprotectant transport system permease protein [Rhodoferax ferrireducens]|uniref:Osmoprotectant transport system permease protein n=1 Tax=Rhodoferax ferrireducens TaxID=192843 RepID=A0ABU2C4G5_9BURK|nr:MULTISPECIES: ABC transporter permease [Rhodoferax]MDR7376225.1 osmoprotectant transport system permease protein [Rhodoferax ferrireducens]SDP47167.1 osmoprotectant transport system permease protein [Rhodoferax sp. OV413]